MDLKDLMKTIADRAHSGATVKTIFGDPIVAGDKTVVPVARVAYAFGAGGGQLPTGQEGDEAGGGGGGGGGVAVVAEGVIEVTPDGTRFIAVGSRRQLAAALVLGVALGLLLGRGLGRR